MPPPIAQDLLRYYAEQATDVYFRNSVATLAGEGLDPVVTAECFCDREGVLCGIKDVVSLLREALGTEGEVWALEEGASMGRKEVVLRVRARYSLFGVYETAILGLLASASGWATAARTVVEAAAGRRVISFGARHVHPFVGPVMDYAAVVGGCVGCSTIEGARLAGLQAPSGTMPHAMVLIFGDTVKAALAYDRHMPDGVLRIVLVDTFKDEVEESLRVAEALGERLLGIRLDTPWERGRVTPDLVKEARAKLDLAGFSHVKIFVSGGLSAERVAEFVAEGAPVDSFGVGMAISAAPPIGFTLDLKEIEGRPLTKRGRIPGLTDAPRLTKVL